jgi:hypothetical protein
VSGEGPRWMRQFTTRGTPQRFFLGWLLAGMLTATAVVISVSWVVPNGFEPRPVSGRASAPARHIADRYAKLAPGCAYLDAETARKAIPGDRTEVRNGPLPSADGITASCGWHRPKEKTGPRREIAVELELFRADEEESGTAKAVQAVARHRTAAEEDVPPGLLPWTVTGLGDEAVASPGQFHDGGVQYLIRRGNVVLRVAVSAGKADPATAAARRQREPHVRGLAEYALARLG